MFIQTNSFGCGSFATMNAIEALGGTSTFEEIKKLAGTSYKAGTTRKGIIHALQAKGYKATPYRTNNPDLAWRWAKRWCASNPMVVLVDNWEHWTCLSGSIGDKIIMVDASPNLDNGHNGVFPYDKIGLLERWVHRGIYYGIRVSK